jgi:hypothetical protein
VGHEVEMAHERRQYPLAVRSSLQVVCAWCQQHIVWHQVQPPMPFPISYSICARCYADVAREFKPLAAGTA